MRRLVDRAAFFDNRKNVAKNLAGVLFIRQRVDRRHAGELRKLLDVALRVSADHRAMNHSRQHPRGIFNQFTATELRVSGVQVNGFAPELANPDLERHSRSRRWLGKNQRPSLAGQRLRRNFPAVRFQLSRAPQNRFDFISRQLLNAK